MEWSLPQRLMNYIDAETADAALYRELSKVSDDPGDSKLLNEFDVDEAYHAVDFEAFYRLLTWKRYFPNQYASDLTDDYREILFDRILDESGDFRKYNREYMSTPSDNVRLKNAFYNAAVDENMHAIRLLYILAKAKER